MLNLANTTLISLERKIFQLSSGRRGFWLGKRGGTVSENREIKKDQDRPPYYKIILLVMFRNTRIHEPTTDHM